MQPIALTAGGNGFCSRFQLFINTWAGRTKVDLIDGGLRHSILLEISPQQSKLTANEFDAMLSELSRKAPGLVWGLSPGSRGGHQTTIAPIVAHPAVIASQLPNFERLLALYTSEAPTLTKRSRAIFPINLTKRTDLSTMRWLQRRPILLRTLLNGEGGWTQARARIDQPISVRSLDHPATRYIAYLLLQLLSRFLAGAQALRSSSGTMFRDPAMEAHAAILADEMEDAAARLKAALNHPLFREVQPQSMNETAQQWLLDHPVYSALYRYARSMLEPRLGYGPNGDIQSALKHTFDLFEIFVLYRLVDELPKRLGHKWRLKIGKSLSTNGRENRPPDRAAWLFEGPDGYSIELRYQQSFARAAHPPDNRRFASLSGVAIPDYILILCKGSRPVRWVLLDAKYRSGRQAVDDGLNDVHRYRDALRIRGKRADGAYIIVPRLQENTAAYAHPAYHHHHGFGVAQILKPDWIAPILQSLQL